MKMLNGKNFGLSWGTFTIHIVLLSVVICFVISQHLTILAINYNQLVAINANHDATLTTQAVIIDDFSALNQELIEYEESVKFMSPTARRLFTEKLKSQRFRLDKTVGGLSDQTHNKELFKTFYDKAFIVKEVLDSIGSSNDEYLDYSRQLEISRKEYENIQKTKPNKTTNN